MENYRNMPELVNELKAVKKKIRELTRENIPKKPLTDIVDSAFEAQGKLIRPTLVMLCGRLGPDYPACRDELVKIASVVEMTHTASLIHDDIIDDAPLRRGKPTVQAAFGKDMAVYAGDYILSRAMSYLMEYSMTQVGAVLAGTIADMCNGEMTQYEAQFNTETEENSYFVSISGKTASIFAAACELGATASGCNKEMAISMSRFGHTLGVLFQLRDDLMDCVSTEKTEGKTPDSDFKRGIYTLPVLYSFVEPKHGRELKELAHKISTGEAEEAVLIGRMRELVTKAGGVDYTHWMIQQYQDKATAMLDQLPKGAAVTALKEMTITLAQC